MADLKVKINDKFNKKSEWLNLDTYTEYELIGLEDFSTPNGSIDFKQGETKKVTGLLASMLLEEYPSKVMLKAEAEEQKEFDDLIKSKVDEALKAVARDNIAKKQASDSDDEVKDNKLKSKNKN